jgi:hypothetical protein
MGAALGPCPSAPCSRAAQLAALPSSRTSALHWSIALNRSSATRNSRSLARCDIGDGIVICNELPSFQPAIENLIEAVRFFKIELLGIRRFARIVLQKVMHLSEHRAWAAHLPHQPFNHAIAGFTGLRQQLAGFIGEVYQERPRFHQRHAVIAVYNRGNTIVRRNLQKFRRPSARL